MKPKSTTESCDTALTAITNRDFRAWNGLPETCTYADFDARFDRMSDGYAIGKQGRKARNSNYRMHVAEGYKTGICVWFEENEIKLIELNYPSLPYPSIELTRTLGKPAARMDYHLDIALIPQGAWIYPRQGITLFVDGPKGEIMKIAVFCPCTLEHYLDELHYDVELTEL